MKAMPGTVRLRLAKILRERGMRNVDLSRSSDMTETLISRLTGNPRQVRLDTLERLCDALNVTPGDLLEYTPEEKPDRS